MYWNLIIRPDPDRAKLFKYGSIDIITGRPSFPHWRPGAGRERVGTSQVGRGGDPQGGAWWKSGSIGDKSASPVVPLCIHVDQPVRRRRRRFSCYIIQVELSSSGDIVVLCSRLIINVSVRQSLKGPRFIPECNPKESQFTYTGPVESSFFVI